MATEKNDSGNDEARKLGLRLRRDAMSKWAKTLEVATWDVSADVTRPLGRGEYRDLELAHVEPDDDEKNALVIVEWLAGLYQCDAPIHPHQRAILRRLDAAFRPAREGQKAALADELVQEHGERIHEAKRPGYKGNPPREIAHQLAVSLWSMVDASFGALDDRLDDVVALLERYERYRGRRSKAGKGTGKVSSTRIVCELNAMVRWPLGRSLKPRGVSNAVQKWRNTSSEK
jgi:hypothetical protein